MKKSEQIKINEKVKEMFNKCMVKGNWDSYAPKGIEWNEHRLRNCSATVITTDYGYYLKSYSTIIAFIASGSDICYDFLRLVYGYTATSAQHISKFCDDYGVTERLTWKEV